MKESSFHPSASKRFIFEKGLSEKRSREEKSRADAVELALERTDVGCFDPSDKVGGEEEVLPKGCWWVLKRSDNFSRVARS